MLSSRKRVNLIHGPPGTGKTYAITAAVAASVASTRNHNFYVLTCQTNAATRNLAVALLKRQVTDFKILVSDNFFVEWHEEQYKVIRNHVVQSSETVNITNFSDRIGPRTVVLCSLSQLSSPRISSVLRQRRVTHIVIDEASQISVANLPHVLALYSESLQRLTFVGDPKQLAPFGHEQHPAVQSIFERMPADVMLQEQYRMPHDLGTFISKEVYKGRLISHKEPRPGCSVALVDVSDGTENKIGTGINLVSVRIHVKPMLSSTSL
ncbi:P-loop containing nucleoside triphosphate hydrolase protein [Gaertneriomyces semiglobifer]|nr:P-loop containing nucleoside triphosphate hydrolase protein [Gaertneriomyces semiglobifer]